MVLFYGCLILLLIFGLSLLTIPFIKNKSLLSWNYFFIILFFCLFTLTLYAVFGQPAALNQKNHYELMVEVNRLGGIHGIIRHIENRLEKNPNDKQAWLILGKLYLIKQDKISSENAFNRAKD